MKLKTIITILILSFWPISLFLANTKNDFLNYVFPTFLLFIAFYLDKKKNNLFQLPVLFIPLIEEKLTLFPLIFSLIFLLLNLKKENFIYLFYFCISITILLVMWNQFIGQTIFIPDYEAQQEVIRKTQLYPSILMARTFHNKARIIIDKFNQNFFALVDPNNYFFGFAPRQIVNNQNLVKFPFLSIIFYLFGLFYLQKSKYKNFIIASFLSSLISLSFLTIFDRNDFILFIPLSLLIIDGIILLEKNSKFFLAFSTLLIIFSIPDLIRFFLIY